jgi:hypothetical protein
MSMLSNVPLGVFFALYFILLVHFGAEVTFGKKTGKSPPEHFWDKLASVGVKVKSSYFIFHKYWQTNYWSLLEF